MNNVRISLLVALVLPALSFGTALCQQSFVVGYEEGEGMLIYPRQIEEGPDGNIYVFDSGDSYIKVYTPDGQFSRRIGGQGEGPGKFQRADGAAFGFTPGGDLLFTEFIGGHRWMTFMALSGDFIKVLSLDVDEAYGIHRAQALADGGYLVHLAFFSTAVKKSDYYLYKEPQALVRIDGEGHVVSTVVETDYMTMISFIPDGATSRLPYCPIFSWVPMRDGEVVFSDGMSSKFKVLDYQGKLLREIQTGLAEPVTVTQSDLDGWKKAREERMMAANPSWYDRFGKVIYKYEKSLYDKPNMSGMTLTRGGRILVAGPWRFDAGRRDYWLMEGDGKISTTVAVGGWGLDISESYVFYMTSDEEGNTVVHCVRRAGTEKDDLSAAAALANQQEN
jgi:hypothetical protein